MNEPEPQRLRWHRRVLTIVGPGVLVAATGVGAGDLATGALTGSKLGVAVLWAVLVGAAAKYVLNEGLARYQLATGDTLLEGCMLHLGRAVQWLLLAYLLIWTFFVSTALMSASGVAAHAILPISHRVFPADTDHAWVDKIIYGLLHSAVAVVLVKLGGYALFEKIMSVCIAMMFLVVVGTTVMLDVSWAAVLRGLYWPTIPQLDGEGLQWTVALIGGVGGTVTVLCYGYWIREEGRHGAEALRTCRIDLAVGYSMTAVFGLCMVIIGSQIHVEGKPAALLVQMASE